jgi:hypothetical protein
VITLAISAFVAGALVALRAGPFALLAAVIATFLCVIAGGFAIGADGFAILISAAFAPVVFQFGAAFTLVLRPLFRSRPRARTSPLGGLGYRGR